MNIEQGFALHPGAAQDITDIWEFIVEDNPLAARRVREDILDAVRELVPFPHQGHKRPDLTTKPLRFQTIRNYIIAYAPDEKPLVVLAVLHGRLVAQVDGDDGTMSAYHARE
jgi:plasmid stabilization system protein ParE